MLRLVHPELGLSAPFIFVDSSGHSTSLRGRGDVTIDLEEKELARGRIGRVFKGRMSVPRAESTPEDEPSTSTIRPVIVKLVMPYGYIVSQKSGMRQRLYHKSLREGDAASSLLADLAHEANLYISPSALSPLQGTVVPICFGFAQSEADNAACLILEDCGEALTFPYRRLPIEDRRRLYELEVSLHQCGISHGDVARRNFVKGPNGIRLIDFDRASFHACLGFSPPNHLFGGNANAKFEDAASCAELKKMCQWFGLHPPETYTLKEKEDFKPWDGIPWGTTDNAPS